MSHSSPVFSRVPIDLPNRSGFDCSHENVGSGTCGTLIPVLVDELLPNDTISLGSALQVQLPPMVSDFYGRVDFVLEAFFVPNRLLWGGWQSFMTHPTARPQYPDGTLTEGKSKYLPQYLLTSDNGASNPDSDFRPITVNSLSAGCLADYLGFRSSDDESPSHKVNALPFLAYHRIWDDWYRDSRIQSPVFYKPDVTSLYSSPEDQPFYSAYLPYISGGETTNAIIIDNNVDGDSNAGLLGDGVPLAALRQRNWAKDYFTTASTLPQAGERATIEVNTAGDSTNISIAALRSANSLQKWLERNNIMGYRYSDQIYGQFGIYPSDAIMDRSIYLGRTTQNVYTRSVFQTSASEGGSNPLGGVGAKYGSSQVIGEGSLCDEIRVTEHGFLIVLASLVPHAYYSSGKRRYLNRSVVGDFAFPMLSGMGDQAIRNDELCSLGYGSDDGVFGYTDLYAEYKYHDDEVHGLLRDGSSLDQFALQRSFDTWPELSSEFLQIPKNFMKQVLATPSAVSGFDYWYDIYFPYKKISTLPQYSLPTLGDLKNVHSKKVSRGGKRL